MFGILK